MLKDITSWLIKSYSKTDKVSAIADRSSSWLVAHSQKFFSSPSDILFNLIQENYQENQRPHRIGPWRHTSQLPSRFSQSFTRLVNPRNLKGQTHLQFARVKTSCLHEMDILQSPCWTTAGCKMYLTLSFVAIFKVSCSSPFVSVVTFVRKGPERVSDWRHMERKGYPSFPNLAPLLQTLL